MHSPKIEGHNIVLVGAWNIRIFTPQWVIENVAAVKEVKVAISIGNASAPLRLEFDGCYLHVGPERLVVAPVSLSESSLESMKRVAEKLLGMLIHTPITAFGVNFRYGIEKEADGVLQAFSILDSDQLSDANAVIVSTSIRRKLRFSEYEMNFTLELDAQGQIQADFNFDVPCKNASVAHENLASIQILQYRERCVEFLETAYNSGDQD